jgi:deazaflavin-dependent oxidoreductase (nitroreductase family)
MTATAIPLLKERYDRIRRFNRRILNPVVLSFAGRRRSPYAVIRHVGRRSGRLYATPVVAVPTEDGFIIPLPYSEATDWCQNLLAGEQSAIVWHGETYPVIKPEVMDAETALAAFPHWMQWTLRRLEIQHFLKVRRLPEAAEGTILANRRGGSRTAPTPAGRWMRGLLLLMAVLIGGVIGFRRLSPLWIDDG